MVTSTSTSGSSLRCNNALITVVANEALSDAFLCMVNMSSFLVNSLISRQPFFCIAVQWDHMISSGVDIVYYSHGILMCSFMI